MLKKSVFIVIMLITGVFSSIAQEAEVLHFDDIPSVDLRSLDEKTVNSRDLLSDTIPLVVSFWATWCKPCIKELNAINEEMEEWLETLPFRVIAISVDDARTTHMVKNLVNSRDWSFEVYLDRNSDLKKLMNVSQPPHLFIIYKGKVVYQHTSYAEGDEEELFEELKKYI